MQADSIPAGLCQCGCGEQTTIAPMTEARRGYVKGQPYRYKSGHGGRKAVRYDVVPGPLATPCHVWRLYIDAQGYAREQHNRRQTRAHIVAWVAMHGPVPAGLELDHLCRNRACVNPKHLEPVTHRINSLRGIGLTALNAAKAHCPQGHPYAGDNLYTSPKGYRFCRTCKRAEGWRYKQRARKIVPVNGNRQEESP